MSEGAQEDQSQIKIRHISEADASQLTDRPRENIFGASLKGLTPPSDSAGLPERSYWEMRISPVRSSLSSAAKRKTHRPYVDMLFNNALADPSSLFSQYKTKNESDPDFDVYDISQMPDEVLADLAARHVSESQQSKERFQQALPDFQRRFQEGFTKEIVSRGFIEDEVFQNRLKRINVNLGDALNMSTMDNHGFFNPYSDTVEIAQQSFDRELGEHVYTHEMLHAISGRTLLEKEIVSDDFKDQNLVVQRVGLRFEGAIVNWFIPANRFQWLNEAITEDLTIKLVGGEELNVYSKERKLYEYLLTRVPEELFLAAYFENYDPDLPQKDRIPKWKQLYDAINKAYKPGYLLRLDKIIQSKGIDAALEEMVLTSIFGTGILRDKEET